MGNEQKGEWLTNSFDAFPCQDTRGDTSAVLQERCSIYRDVSGGISRRTSATRSNASMKVERCAFLVIYNVLPE